MAMSELVECFLRRVPGVMVLALLVIAGVMEPVAVADSAPAAVPTATTVSTAVAPESPVVADTGGSGRVYGRSATAAGAAHGGGREARSAAQGNSGSWMWRYMLSMLVVGGLLLLALNAVKRLRTRVMGQAKAGIQIRERVALDGKHTLALVKVKDRELLLGYSQQGDVQVLQSWEAAEGSAADDAATGDGAPGVAGPECTGFAALLARAIAPTMQPGKNKTGARS